MSLAAMIACQSQPQSEAPEPDEADVDSPTPVVVGPSRQVDDLVSHAVLAFRPTATGYVGGYTTHRATVRDGLVEVTPFSFTARDRQPRSPVRLETAAILVGGAALGELTGSRLDNGSVVLERGEIEERLRNEPDGLHQEWVFPAAPDGAGDLVVELAVFGQQYVATTDSGIHFASAGGGAVRYSHAVWVSGDGATWPILASHDSGRIRLTVPESVLASTVFPAVLDPTISAESDVDVPVLGPVGANTAFPAVASDGTGYLVVWEDERNSEDSDIWGTRLDAAGAIVDSLGIEIAAGPGRQAAPTVAFDGTRYVVAWQDFKVRNGTIADLGAATVTPAGAVSPLASIASTTTSKTDPALAAAGGTALLVWHEGGDVNGAVLPSGGASFAAPFGIAATGAAEVTPAVAADASGNYLAVWSEGPAAAADLRGQLVTSAGTLSGAALTLSAGAGFQSLPSASFDGTSYAVAWINSSAGALPGGRLSVMGTRVTTAGVVQDTHLEAMVPVGGVEIAIAPAIPNEVSIACLASGCFVGWTDRRSVQTANSFDLFGQALQPDFTRQGSEVALAALAGKQLTPAIAASSTSFVSAWSDTRDGAVNSVFGTRISSAGVPDDTGRTLATGLSRESQPALGIATKTFGVFWGDSRSSGSDIRMVRYNTNSSKLDQASVPAVSEVNAQQNPAASSDLGASTLVVWVDGRLGINKDIFGARFSMTTGGSLDGSGFPIATEAGDQLTPAVASNGTVALVVWTDRRAATSDIRGALVTSAGAIAAPDIAICTNAVGDQARPAVTWDPASSQFIVLWSDNRSGVSHIFGARISAAGAVLDPDGVAVSGGAVGQFTPALASNALGSFAVWEDRKLGQDIFGTRLSGGGALVVRDPSGIAISTAAGGQTMPKIASLGTSYAVVWVDGRNGQTDVMGQQLTTGGALSGGEFVVSNGAGDELNPAIMKGFGNGNARVAYESRRLNTTLVETRLITSEALIGGVCSSAAQCSTGFCVDGRCCDTACGGDDPTDCQACSNVRSGQPDGVCSPRPTTAICRPNASTFCDVREQCDGVNTSCPPDLPRAANVGRTCDLGTNNPPGTGTGTCKAAGEPGPYLCF